jgi:hypothetical protein
MYKRTKYSAVVEPTYVDGVPTTASATVVSGSCDVSLQGINGANLNALQNGDEFWVVAGSQTGDYQIKLTCNSCSNATDIGGENVFEFQVQQDSLASFDLKVATYGTYPNYEYNPSGGNYSYQPQNTVTRDYWVDAVGGTYSGKVKLTATYKAFGLVHVETRQSAYVGFPVGGTSVGIPGFSTRINLPEVSGGVRAAGGIIIQVPHDSGCYENPFKTWTNALSWPLYLHDQQGGSPVGPTESGALDNTFSAVGSSAARSLTVGAFVEVSVNSANFNKGQGWVSISGTEINNPVFAIVP